MNIEIEAGIPTRVLSYGPEDGEVVICVHGLPAAAPVFAALAGALAQRGYRVMVPDLPGALAAIRALEPGPVAPQLARFVSSAIAELSPKRRPILVAHSQGAYAAAELLGEQPELAQGLVAIGPAGLDEPRWTALVSRPWFGLVVRILITAIGSWGRRRLARVLYDAMGGGRGAESFANMVADRRTAMSLVLTGVTSLRELRAQRLDPAKILVRTLWIFGGKDRRSPASGAARCAVAENATVRIIEELGHNSMVQDPERIAQLIHRWLHE